MMKVGKLGAKLDIVKAGKLDMVKARKPDMVRAGKLGTRRDMMRVAQESIY
jgi:hypothetical protein